MKTEFVRIYNKENLNTRIIVSVEGEPGGGYAIRGIEVSKVYPPGEFIAVLDANGFDETDAALQIEECLAKKKMEQIL